MNLSALASFIICTGLIALVSYIKTRKRLEQTTSGLFFANRKNNFLVVGGALLLSNISANQFIGENESIYINNMSVIAWGVSSVLAMVITAEFFLPIYFKTGAMTIPDYLGKRYGRNTKKLVSFVFLSSYAVNLLPSCLYGGAVAFIGMFNFLEPLQLTYWQNIWIMVWIIGTLGACYSVLGGLRAITISDTLLSLGLIAIGIALPYYGLSYLGNNNWQAGLDLILNSHKEHLNSIGTLKDEVPFDTIFTGMLIMNLYYWGMEQFIVQQALSAKSLSHSQKGITLACIGKLLCPFLINVPGILGVHLYPSLENSAEVFPLVVKDTLPHIFVGLTAAIVLGAAITTFNAGLNSSSTILILNLYKPWLEKNHKKADEKTLVRYGRRFEIYLSITAMLAAPFILFASSGFYTYLQQLAGMFCVPVFTVVLLGFVSKKVTGKAANMGILFFICCYIVFNYLLNVQLHYLHMLALLFLLTSIFMLVFSYMSRPSITSLNTTDYFSGDENVSIEPWRGRHKWFIVLIICTVAIFILFSPWGIA